MPRTQTPRQQRLGENLGEISFEEVMGGASPSGQGQSQLQPQPQEISFTEAAGPQEVRRPLTQRISEHVSGAMQTQRTASEAMSTARATAIHDLFGDIDSTPEQGFLKHTGKTALRGIRAIVTDPQKAVLGGVKAIAGGAVSMVEQVPAGLRGIGRAAGGAIVRETVGQFPIGPGMAPGTAGAIQRARDIDPVAEGVKGIESSMDDTMQMREAASQITRINLAPEGETEEAMEGLLMLIPEGITAAGDTVYDKTGSALAGAGTQGLLTLLSMTPQVAGKVVGRSVESVKSKQLFNTTFDALAKVDGPAAKEIIQHVEQTAPKAAAKLRMRYNAAQKKWTATELGEKVVKAEVKAKGKTITAEEAGVGLSDAAAEMPQAPQAKPVSKVEFIPDEDTGAHVVRSPAGEILTQENRGYLQIKRSDVLEAERGKGHAQEMMRTLLEQAESRDLVLGSDFSVSKDAQRVYEALRKKGFNVKENPNTVNPETGSKVTVDPRVPVYEVSRARAAAKPAAVTKPASPVLESPEFRQWFKDSKVTTPAGTPQVLYHGTARNFRNFSRLFTWGRAANPTDWGRGFYFTDSPMTAGQYAEKAGGNIRPVYLNIKRPATNKVMQSREIVRALEDEGQMGFTSVREVLEKKGYDGIVYKHTNGVSEYIVFRANQIRSALTTGKAKTGTDMLAAAKEAIAPATVEQVFVSGPTLDALPGGKFIKGKLTGYWDELIRAVNPEALGSKARQAAAVLGEKIAQQMNKNSADIGLSAERLAFWEKVPLTEIREFMKRYETGKAQKTAELQAVDKYLRERAKEIYEQDQRNGIKYDPVDNYLYHVFQDGEKLTRHFEAKYGAKWGDPKFTKDRAFDLYEEAIEAGFKPKYTNPEDIILARQLASDLAQTRVELLNDLVAYGLAVEKTKANPKAPKGEYNFRRAPNGKGYWIEATADAILYNAFDTKSLWSMRGVVGDVFKGMMFLKNHTVPAVLSLSLFHPLHLLLGMDSAASMTRLTKEMVVSGMSPVKWFGKWLEQMTLGSKGIPFYGIVDNPKVGFRLLKAVEGKLDPAKLTAADLTALQFMNEGGFAPVQPIHMRANSLVNFRTSVRRAAAEFHGQGGLRRAAGPALKAGFHAPFAIIDAMQYPMFRLWIPALKIASYLKDVQTALKLDPTLAQDKARRILAFRKLSKSVDNRYGEMNYNTLFWNRLIKDTAVANMLSLGWNLGFVREYGGGGIDVTRTVRKGKLVEKVKAGELDRPLFVMFYTTQVMLYSGLLTWAMTGKLPTEFTDYLYPKSGEKDAQGNDERLSTPFYPREFAAIAKHVEHEGVAPGLWHVIQNKSSGVLGLVRQWATGVDWRGHEFRDPNSAWHQKMRDTLAVTLQDLEPISVGQLRQSEGTRKDFVTSITGFGPAPKYVTQSNTEAKVSQLYRKYYSPQQTPYETALVSNDRRQLAKFYEDGNVEEYSNLLDEMMTKYNLTAAEQGRLARNIMRRGQDYNPYLTMFERLTWQQQKRLLDDMSEDERAEYLPHANREHLRYSYEEPE